MPHESNSDLPERVKDNLPDHGREETARRAEWFAAQKVYQKDEDGTWKRKD